MKQHQNTILWQINERKEQERQHVLRNMEDERERRLKELQYQMRIQQEREKGRQMVSRNIFQID